MYTVFTVLNRSVVNYSSFESPQDAVLKANEILKSRLDLLSHLYEPNVLEFHEYASLARLMVMGFDTATCSVGNDFDVHIIKVNEETGKC